MVRRVIWVSDVGAGRLQTLIHEITHAVAGANHGRRWRTRMYSAARTARRLGDMNLAQRLTLDADEYERSEMDGGRLRACDVYGQLREMATGGRRYVDVVRHVARTLGLNDREFRQRYRRSREEFERGRRFHVRSERVREALLARLHMERQTAQGA